MGRCHSLATADSIYSDENNFLSLALSTSSTQPLPPTSSAAKNNKRQKEEVEGGGDYLV